MLEYINENELKMLQIIRHNPGKTKSELATKVQMPWSSAYAIITKLDEKILVLQDNSQIKESNNGSNKYKAGIFIDPTYEYYVGISVGSSQVKVVLIGFDFSIVSLPSHDNQYFDALVKFKNKLSLLGFDFREESLYKCCMTTPSDIEELCKILCSVCKAILELKLTGFKIAALNFALPGYIDFYNQKIISMPNLCNNSDFVKGAKISRLITSAVYDDLINNYIPIYIDHNVKSSAVAEKEHRFTKNPDDKSSDLMVVYLGRGVGISMIVNGSLYRDKDNLAGQLGEVRVYHNGALAKLGDVIRQCVLGINNSTNLTANQLREELEKEENSNAKRCLVDVLAQAVSSLIQVVYVKDIVFSGKLNDVFDLIEFEFNNALREYGIYDVQLKHSVYGEYSAAVGAAMSCFYNKYGVQYSWN